MSELVDTVRRWGLSVSLSQTGENIRVHPWSAVTKNQRNWFVENKPALIDELKKNGYKNFRGSITDGSFPEFLKDRARFGDAVGKAIEENFFSALVPKDSEKKGCGCKDYAKRLNSRSVEQCIAIRDEIQNKLVDQSNLMIAGAKLIPNAIKRSQAKKIVDAAIEKTTPQRKPFPDDVAVITAADRKFSRGLYGLAWTTIYQNDVKFIAYDLGVGDKTKAEIQRWGVNFKPWSSVFDADFDGWQTYNKPFIIRDALKQFDRVIWIDSDILVGGDLSQVLEMLETGLLVPDHGLHQPPKNRNQDCSNDVLGNAKKQWGELSPSHFPCCGFMGFNSERDFQFVNDWCDAIQKVVDSDSLDCFSYYDQGVFQQIYDGPLIDGKVWNNVRVPRRTSANELLKFVFETDSMIYHSGGDLKYWEPWASMRWVDPNFVGSK